MPNLDTRPASTTLPEAALFYALDLAQVGAEDRKVTLGSLRKILGGNPATDCELYVSKTGHDTEGDGSILAPFLTVQAAINSVTDATANKQYTVIISPGYYNENITCKAWVHLSSICANGVGEIGKGPVRLTGNITANFTGADVNGIVILSGIDIDSGGGSVLCLGQGFLYLQTCRLAGFYGCESSSRINYISCLGEGAVDITGGNQNFTACRIGGDFTIGESNTWLGHTTANLTACRFDGYFRLAGVTGGNINAYVNACKLGEVRVQVGSGSPVVNLYTDSSFRPSLLNIVSGAVTISLLTEAAGLKYAATVPADWAGTAPVTVQEAIDRIAAFNPGA